MPQTHSYHTVGLGSKFLGRSRLIFSVSLLIFVAATGAVGYAGAKTGEFERDIFVPVQKFLASLSQDEEQPPLPPEITLPPTTTEDQKVVPQGRSAQKTEPPLPPAVIYQQPSLGEFPSDWAKQQSEESRRSLEEFTKQSQQKLEEFKRQAGEGWEKFREEQKLNQQKFEQQIPQ